MNPIKLTFALTPEDPTPLSDSQETSKRVSGFLNRFAKDLVMESLIQTHEGQIAFGVWLTQWQKDSSASKKALRNDLRLVRRFAQDHHLQTLDAHVESLLLDTRNNVPNKQQNYNLSHLISQDTFNRIAAYEEARRATELQQNAVQVFAVTCMTGLRTSEWDTVELHTATQAPLPGEDRPYPYLRVMTAKTRKEVVEPRYLILDGFNQSQVHLIDSVIRYIQSIPKGIKTNLVIQARRVMSSIYSDDPVAMELIKELDFRTARKVYTCEMRRGGASAKETAAALGHTTIMNLRHYAQGDIACDRKTTLPLARPPKGSIETVRDTLAELNERRIKAGQPSINGYPDAQDALPSDTEDEQALGQRFLDKL